MASEPSALKMRIEKSATEGSEGAPMSTKPSEPMPKWRSLHLIDVDDGSATLYNNVLT